VLIVDKTGTLTYGKPSLTEVHCFGGMKRETALQYVASLERYSKHPLASAVLTAVKAEGLPFLEVEDVSEAPGAGLTEVRLVAVTGRGKLSRELAAAMPSVASGLECVMLLDGGLAGVFHFQDEPRRESKSFLKHLGTKHSIKEVILLSGDRSEIVPRHTYNYQLLARSRYTEPPQLGGVCETFLNHCGLGLHGIHTTLKGCFEGNAKRTA
jgi:P-type E1-E2 ATPase